MQKISIKNDFLGVNYYSRALVKFFQDSKLNYQSVKGNLKKTAMGWEIYPQGLYDIIVRLRKEYTQLPIYITENGAAFDDTLSEEKQIKDVERINYIKSHLIKIAELNQQGADIRGYYLWSLMDNFEWAYGYSKRFGIVYVDYKTQERILKDSALWYKDVIKNRTIK
ncbi:Beta-glucosidase A [subsurface metagenome]